MTRSAGATTDVATTFGPLAIPAHDNVIRLALEATGAWEPQEAAAIASLLPSGGTLVDLGAHVGLHTLAGARAVGPTGRVVAFEPDPLNYSCLRTNIARLGLQNVEAHPVAAWRKSGRVHLRRDDQNTGDHRTSRRRGRGTIPVPAVALDDLAPHLARIDVVKSDLQGRDHLALLGMRDLLRRHRPTVLVEFWPEGIADAGWSSAAVLRLYRRLGFGWRVLGGRLDGAQGLSPKEAQAAAQAEPGGYLTLVLEPGMP